MTVVCPRGVWDCSPLPPESKPRAAWNETAHPQGTPGPSGVSGLLPEAHSGAGFPPSLLGQTSSALPFLSFSLPASRTAFSLCLQ